MIIKAREDGACWLGWNPVLMEGHKATHWLTLTSNNYRYAVCGKHAEQYAVAGDTVVLISENVTEDAEGEQW